MQGSEVIGELKMDRQVSVDGGFSSFSPSVPIFSSSGMVVGAVGLSFLSALLSLFPLSLSAGT